MKILIFSWRGPGHPDAGGAEISTHEHAKRWVEAGHNVTLFTSFYKGAKRQDLIDGVKIIRSGSQNLGVHAQAFIWYLFKNHLKFDMVVDQFHGIPFFTPLFIRAKKFGFIHEVTKEVWKLNQFPTPFNFFVAILGNILEPFIFKLYKGVHFMTVSESTKKDLIDWGIPDDKVSIIHNGINVPIFKTPPPKEKRKTLIYLGALAKDKGIEDVLEVFTHLQKDWSSNLQFWIVGKSDLNYLKFLKYKAFKLKLKNIKFWGYVDEYKKFNLLGRSHILVNPSIREGWGLVVIEAAAMGTPTVAFNIPGLRDSIINGRTGILSNEHSDQSLANEIIELLEDARKLKRISQNAVSWSKNFSWEKSTNASLKLIEDLVE